MRRADGGPEPLPRQRQSGDAARPAAPRGQRTFRFDLQADRRPDIPTRRTLRRWIALALERDARLTLRFVDAREGRRLNRDFRRKDYATNVLTFDYALRPVVIADIVICLPVVRREARQQRKSLRAHLAHLVVHGVLHAQGYDHRHAGDARRMERREIALLARLRIPNPYEAC